MDETNTPMKKILVVDDNPNITELLEEMLKSKGYDVMTTSSGKSCIEQARCYKPDLIILDLKLPDLPGEEVCREIRRDELMSKTPIIMFTGKDSEADRVIGRVIGANRYITKPCDLHEILTAIEDEFGKDEESF